MMSCFLTDVQIMLERLQQTPLIVDQATRLADLRLEQNLVWFREQFSVCTICASRSTDEVD